MERHIHEFEADSHENKPEKTADEMFRELGYVLAETLSGGRTYIHEVDDISVYISELGYLTIKGTDEAAPGVVRAICKLLDEVGVE